MDKVEMLLKHEKEQHLLDRKSLWKMTGDGFPY